MAYQMTLTLTDQEYALLKEEAAKNGVRPEIMLQEMMRERLQASLPTRPMTGRDLMVKLYHEGEIENLPTSEPLTTEEQAERERLARLFSSEKLISDTIIEDRGPY